MAALLHVVLIAALAAAAPSSTNPHRIWDTSPGATASFSEYYPLGNGRLGILASCDPRTEQIRLNENSFWSGSLLSRVNPDGAATVAAMRQMVKEGRYAEAEDLGLMGYTGTPMSTRHFDKMGEYEGGADVPCSRGSSSRLISLDQLRLSFG
ncbi:glycosyl hydrolase family 65, N-terminal domain-containing protein [Schizothecium vesticola]|uniref:Glycosyl hydrolase family 65, N-terminal domain-containing protein n=1 Tax=Schizothecium vesticola TaxID=314040 RepID=A0AA40K0M2_9PEZI|nr:glycosyl hydrolase family 65, N-terminal domain-containing protein [Schizothecium vesticola]